MLELTFPLAVLGGAVCGMRMRIAPFAAFVVAVSLIAALAKVFSGFETSILDFVVTVTALQVGYVIALICQARFAADEQPRAEVRPVTTDSALVDHRPA